MRIKLRNNKVWNVKTFICNLILLIGILMSVWAIISYGHTLILQMIHGGEYFELPHWHIGYALEFNNWEI